MSYIGNQPAPVNVTSTSITDGTIVNADISSSAAIAISKLDGVTYLTTTRWQPRYEWSGYCYNF